MQGAAATDLVKPEPEQLGDTIENLALRGLQKQMFENQVKQQQVMNNQGQTIQDMMLQLYRSQQQRERERQQERQPEQEKQVPQKKPEEAKSAEERLTKVKRKIQYD